MPPHYCIFNSPRMSSYLVIRLKDSKFLMFLDITHSYANGTFM